MKPNLNFTARMAGHFTLKATNINTGKERILGDFPNLILDSGLNRIGSGSYADKCVVRNWK